MCSRTHSIQRKYSTSTQRTYSMYRSRIFSLCSRTHSMQRKYSTYIYIVEHRALHPILTIFTHCSLPHPPPLPLLSTFSPSPRTGWADETTTRRHQPWYTPTAYICPQKWWRATRKRSWGGAGEEWAGGECVGEGGEALGAKRGTRNDRRILQTGSRCCLLNESNDSNVTYTRSYESHCELEHLHPLNSGSTTKTAAYPAFDRCQAR